MRRNSFKSTLISLYHGASPRSRKFRLMLMVFDILTILFFVVTTMLADSWWIRIAELFFALIISLDFLARLKIAPNRINYFMQFTSWTDMIVIATLLAPAFTANFAFLRVLRSVRLLRSFHVLKELRQISPFFKRNEEVIQSIINLGVFVFVVTALVYVLQVRSNPDINNYIDALYFTITTLTTTGFGDITLQGSSGRIIAILIMVIGVALFLRLVQTIFRPPKIRYKCVECGLTRHETDAVHCKHCGKVLNIETEGQY